MKQIEFYTEKVNGNCNTYTRQIIDWKTTIELIIRTHIRLYYKEENDKKELFVIRLGIYLALRRTNYKEIWGSVLRTF